MSKHDEASKVCNDMIYAWHMAGYDGIRYVGVMLYVLCLKKMIDTNVCPAPQHMGIVLEITKSFLRPASNKDIENFKQGAYVLEETYGLESGLLRDVLDAMRSQEEQWQKTFLKVVSIIADKDCYAEAAELLMYKMSQMRGNERMSSYTVAELLRIASAIKNEDRVLDGTVGFGYSARECIKDKKVHFTGTDIHREAIQISAMYFILTDLDPANLRTQDFTYIHFEEKFNKVVMDIPFGMKIKEMNPRQAMHADRWMKGATCKEMENLFIASGLDSLKEDGRMVTIVPQGFLWRSLSATAILRDSIVREGMLKAVISLPAVYNYTIINAAMLVFERGNSDVIFVDATKLIQRPQRRFGPEFREEDKQLLAEIIEERKIVEGISFLISNEEILENGQWSIGAYQKDESAVVKRKMFEIDLDLNSCYQQLEDLEERNRELSLFWRK